MPFLPCILEKKRRSGDTPPMQKKRRVLVTAALPYSNGRPHVGHLAGCYISSDTYVRYLRMTGADVRFICGSDDYGVAIVLSAQKEGKTPAEVAEYYNRKQADAFARMGIKFDIYSSTSRCPHHTKTSQEFFLNVHEKGYFEKQESEQFFDPEKNMFLPDRFVKGTCGFCNTPDQNGDQCENCGKALDTDSLIDPKSVFSGQSAVRKKTTHWYLDLSHFEKQVAEWIDTATLREHTRSYVKGLLSTGLIKRSMTRDISWGIPVPLNEEDAKGKVLYVWFDAPIGYISNTKELCATLDGDAERFKDWWQSQDTDIYHFIGEDNTIFHCIIWIAMLNAEGSIRLPKGVIVNQFLNIQQTGKDVEKISKSRGNAPWIEDYLDEGGDPDSLRYYLTMVAPERSRTAYQPHDLVQRHNSELANILGNFVNRILTFTTKNIQPTAPAYEQTSPEQIDLAFEQSLRSCVTESATLIEEFSFRAALERIMEFARECNRYVDEKAPWKTRKTDMEVTKATIVRALWSIKALGIMLAPFMPFTSEKILRMLSIDPATASWNDAAQPLATDSPIIDIQILFSKIDTTEE